MKSVLLFARLVLVYLSLTGCDMKTTWKEEVEINNDEIIIINRETNFSPGGADLSEGQGYRPREYVIRFEYPNGDGKIIEWRSSKRSTGLQPELPIVLMRGPEKSLIIYTVLSINSACSQYFKYQLKNKKWEEIKLQENIETAKANLYFDAWKTNIYGVISASVKKDQQTDSSYHSSVKQVGPNRFSCINDYVGPYPPPGSIE